MPNETFHKKSYIQYRWKSEQTRFEQQAKLNQRLSVLMTITSLVSVVGALLTSPFDDTPQIILFGVALVAITVNILYNFKDRAKRYRGIAEALRREREMFDAGAGIYTNTDKAFTRFVRRCEAIIQSGGEGHTPLIVDEEEDFESRPSTLPGSPFGSRSSSSSPSSFRSRLGNRLSSSSSDDDDDDDNDEDSSRSSRSRFGSPFSSRSSNSPFGSRSSGSSPFGNRSSNSPFGSNPRYSGGRPIGSSGGMRREGNDDPALAGIQTGNGNTGIRFSAYYTKEVIPKEWQPLKAYAFMGYAVDAVTVDAEGGDPDKVPEILYDRNRSARNLIPEGAQVTVTPRMKGFQFNPQSVNIGFYRTWHRFDFEMRAVDAKLDEATNGFLTFTVDGLIVADVPVSVYVASSLEKDRKNMTRQVLRKPYKRVYASFADEDVYLAQRLRQIYDALGMYNLRDVMQHRAENGWNENMLKSVDDAEVFQLFWSNAAANSETVERELHQALERTAPPENFVRVVYWEQPPAALPPVLQSVNAEYLPDVAE